MFEIKGLWSSDRKMKIGTGLSVKKYEFIFEDFEVV